MADFLESEAEESDEEPMEDNVSPVVHRNIKKIVESDEDEEEDDGEEVNDLIDDNPIEEDSDNESDRSRKRKKSDDEDDEDFDDRLEDEDYDLLEENLGVKIQKKRRRIIQGEDSDDEGTQDGGDDRDAAPTTLFDGSDNEEAPTGRIERDDHTEESEGEDSEGDGFIVDDEDRPLKDKRKKRKPIFADHTLQEAQDIFGVDFDYDEFEKYEDQYDEEEEEEEEDEYEDEDQRNLKTTKKVSKKRRKPKSIYEIYEPSELERAGFTDEDSKIRSQDVPERMQLRTVPIVPATEEELDEEAEWIYDTIFKNRPDTFQNPMDNDMDIHGNSDDAEPVSMSAPAAEPNWDADNDDWDADTPTQPVLRNPTAPANKSNTAAGGDDDDWDAPVASPPRSTPAAAPPPKPKPVATGDDDDWDAPIASPPRPAPAAPTPKPLPATPVIPVPKAGADDEDWDLPPTQPMPPPPAPGPPAAKKAPVVHDPDDWDAPEPEPGSSPPASVAVPPPAGTVNWDDDNWDKSTSVVHSSLHPNQILLHQTAEEIKGRYIPKIRKALEFMRNQNLEVPFIAFYRKEYVQPELNINDLWTIYREDGRFCQLRARKINLTALFEKMREYQASLIMSKPNDPIPDTMRIISDEDMEHLKTIQTHEELKDAYMQFSLYYHKDVPLMREHQVKKRKERVRSSRQNTEVDPDNPSQELPVEDDPELLDGEDENDQTSTVKRKVTGGTYGLCVRQGISGFARKFGLPPDRFAQNVRDNYQRNEVDQDPTEPLEAAAEYCTSRFPTAVDVVKAGRYMMAMQISREPVLRRAVREVVFERATISVSPTKKGLKEIDENHPLYPVKYLKGKPVREVSGDMFLRITTAEEDGLVNVKIAEFIKGITHTNYVDEVKQLYYKDEFTGNVQLWNELRGEMIELALETHVFPALRKELRVKLMNQAKNHILEAAASKLRRWLEVKPYDPEFSDIPEDDEDGDWVTSRGIKVLAIAYVPDLTQVSFACFIGVDGEPSDYLRLSNITKSTKGRESDKLEKEADLVALKNFIRIKKPHVVVVGGESREATMIQEDVKYVCLEIAKEDKVPIINVEILDNQLSKVYSNSIKAMNDFREYPSLLREAISLGRKLQDAMIEYSQLCTADDEILCLRYHPLQDQVPREELLEYLQLEFVNRVNEVGVDVNRCIALPHTANILQFVCGLGPRKATQLLKVLKQNNHRLENRTQLITLCHMGPKVFINCSGFIKIDTNALGDSTDAYVEALDSSRVHPETYEWARKMAVDALDLDDEDTNPATALEEILLAPERLKDLDLDAFAAELARQGFGDKKITLYDIRKELNPVYADYRIAFQPPTSEELFNILTKETPDTLYLGKLIVATVIGVTHKKPQGEQLDNAVPVKNEITGTWQCSFCFQSDFTDLSEVWNHFDANACPGQATGIRLRLDSGIFGFIPISKLSDKEVTNPESRVRKGQSVHCRITRIDVDRLSVECTSRTSDLVDASNEWRPQKDPYYDHESEEAQRKKEDEMKQQKSRMTYVKRVIIHPSFKNISFREAEKLMDQMDQGDAIIRPSSKGEDHLTITWKVCDGVYQHIDIKEQGKENAFSLGQSLWIGEEEFEDLDEIIARFINPMAACARDILNYKYFKTFENRKAVDEYLLQEKERSANKIHYILYPSKEFPGKFVIAYLPKDKVRHEFISLKSEGFRFRGENFETLGNLLKWFKEHYRDPPPQATPINNPVATRTPFATPGNNVEAIPRLVPPPGSSFFIPAPAQSHVSHVSHVTHVATTPHFAATTPAQAFTPYASHTPYTPTAQTPYMTPYQQPGFPTTPAQHAQVTPGFVHPAQSTISTHRTQTQRIPQPARSTVSIAASESLDWRKAAEAWASSHQKRHGQHNRHDGEGARTPATRDAASIISEGIEKTRQMSHAVHNFTPNHNNHRSPRGGRDSLRSTPKTNFSPRSMIESSLGDDTPLFDEH